jgi:hypothetical protein
MRQKHFLDAMPLLDGFYRDILRPLPKLSLAIQRVSRRGSYSTHPDQFPDAAGFFTGEQERRPSGFSMRSQSHHAANG